MKVVEPRVVEITRPISEHSGDFWHSIEFAARICYHTQDGMTITEEESKEWVHKRLLSTIGISHNRALEFGTIYLTIPWWRVFTILWYCINHWSRMTKWGKITTNYRVIYENKRDKDLKYWGWSKEHAQRRTLLWTISRGIADEFRTHCEVSSLMQSTRYCMYTSPRMGEEVCFVAPTWVMDGTHVNLMYQKWQRAEDDYKELIAYGHPAQEAREVLPLSVKTEFIQCAFEDEWKHFFALRAEDTEHNHPHPDSIYVASKAKKILFGDK